MTLRFAPSSTAPSARLFRLRRQDKWPFTGATTDRDTWPVAVLDVSRDKWPVADVSRDKWPVAVLDVSRDKWPLRPPV